MLLPMTGGDLRADHRHRRHSTSGHFGAQERSGAFFLSQAVLVTKGSLAVTLGVGVRLWIAGHVSPRYVRYGAVGAMIVLGVLSVLEVLGILTD